MQGNCNEDTTRASKIQEVHTAQLKPGQCVLVTSTSAFNVETSFWLDNIYIMQRPGKTPQQKGVVPAMIIVGAAGKLWATDVTVEGDRVSSQEGMRVEKGGHVFLDGALLSVQLELGPHAHASSVLEINQACRFTLSTFYTRRGSDRGNPHLVWLCSCTSSGNCACHDSLHAFPMESPGSGHTCFRQLWADEKRPPDSGSGYTG